MNLYRATPDEDILLAHWYMQLVHAGELERLFTADSRSLGALMRIVGPPKTLLYERDVTGVWLAMWGEQFLRSAFIGLWVRPDKRRTRVGLNALLEAYEWYFQAVPTLFGITKQPNLLEEHERLGYAVVDEVSELWDGETAWIVKLTRESFVKTLRRFKRPAAELAEIA